MNEQHDDREHVARLMLAMEKHTAFIEGAMGIEISPVFREDDVILSEVPGMDATNVCYLAFPSRTSQSG